MGSPEPEKGGLPFRMLDNKFGWSAAPSTHRGRASLLAPWDPDMATPLRKVPHRTLRSCANGAAGRPGSGSCVSEAHHRCPMSWCLKRLNCEPYSSKKYSLCENPKLLMNSTKPITTVIPKPPLWGEGGMSYTQPLSWPFKASVSFAEKTSKFISFHFTFLAFGCFPLFSRLQKSLETGEMLWRLGKPPLTSRPKKHCIPQIGAYIQAFRI